MAGGGATAPLAPLNPRMHMCLHNIFVYSLSVCIHIYMKHFVLFLHPVQGGPYGVLATVQAYVLKHLLFTSGISVVASIYVIYCDLFYNDI